MATIPLSALQRTARLTLLATLSMVMIHFLRLPRISTPESLILAQSFLPLKQWEALTMLPWPCSLSTPTSLRSSVWLSAVQSPCSPCLLCSTLALFRSLAKLLSPRTLGRLERLLLSSSLSHPSSLTTFSPALTRPTSRSSSNSLPFLTTLTLALPPARRARRSSRRSKQRLPLPRRQVLTLSMNS